MNYLYIAPWIVWVLWFIGWEAWGFRKANDHWPTLSQVIKGWEDHQLLHQGKWTPVRQVPPYHRNINKLSRAVKRGVVTWSWQRWCVAVGLPVVAVLLELHWVWEVR